MQFYQKSNSIFHINRKKQYWNVHGTTKDTEYSKLIMTKNEAGVITLPVFTLYYKASVTKAVWYCHENKTHRPMELESRAQI